MKSANRSKTSQRGVHYQTNTKRSPHMRSRPNIKAATAIVTPVNLIGASQLPLSSRFSSLQSSDTNYKSHTKPIVLLQKATSVPKTVKKQKRLDSRVEKVQKVEKLKNVMQNNRQKRQKVVNNRRLGLKETQTVKREGIVNAVKRKKQGKGGQKGDQRVKVPIKVDGMRKKAVNGDQLDVEMDAYWHQGGKGPEPKAAQLDRQMEQYWATKPENDVES